MRPYITKSATVMKAPKPSAETRYDAERQVSVIEGTDTPAVRSHATHLATKKADRERGEDVKDRWS